MPGSEAELVLVLDGYGARLFHGKAAVRGGGEEEA